jgi:hypothetical protein
MRDDTDSTSPVDDLVRDRLEHSRRAVDVLAEAVAVLRSFGTDDTHLTVDELVGRTGLTLGVVQELVQASSPLVCWSRPASVIGSARCCSSSACARRPSVD